MTAQGCGKSSTYRQSRDSNQPTLPHTALENTRNHKTMHLPAAKLQVWREILCPKDVLCSSTSQAKPGVFQSRAVSIPPAKDASSSSPTLQHPVSYPGSPWSWGSLGAIRSLASLKSTQRRIQTLQIYRGRSEGCHARAGVQEAGDPPRVVSLGLGPWQGGHVLVFHARKWAARGKAANSGADLGSLAAVQPCRADLTFFPLPGERGGIIQGNHRPASDPGGVTSLVLV